MHQGTAKYKPPKGRPWCLAALVAAFACGGDEVSIEEMETATTGLATGSDGPTPATLGETTNSSVDDTTTNPGGMETTDTTDTTDTTGGTGSTTAVGDTADATGSTAGECMPGVLDDSLFGSACFQ